MVLAANHGRNQKGSTPLLRYAVGRLPSPITAAATRPNERQSVYNLDSGRSLPISLPSLSLPPSAAFHRRKDRHRHIFVNACRQESTVQAELSFIIHSNKRHASAISLASCRTSQRAVRCQRSGCCVRILFSPEVQLAVTTLSSEADQTMRSRSP